MSAACRRYLTQVYNTMIANCAELIGISSAIAGLGTLWYVAGHIWVDIAEARRVNVRPLFRPFLIALAITFFPAVIAILNSVLQPTVDGTAALAGNANQAVATLLQEKQQLLQQSAEWQMYTGTDGSGSLDKWEQLSGDADSGLFSGLSNRVKFEMAKVSYNLKSSVRVWMSEILETLFEAAGLCINTVRTFYLIVLAILGPLAFAFSVYPGLEGSFSHWLSHYIHVFLWLPVANLFGIADRPGPAGDDQAGYRSADGDGSDQFWGNRCGVSHLFADGDRRLFHRSVGHPISSSARVVWARSCGGQKLTGQ